MGDPGLLLITVSFTLSIYWTVFFIVRMARMLAAQAMPLQDVLWAGGLQGVPSVWLARIEARGRDGQLTMTGAPAGWFGHREAQEAPRPIVDSGSAGDHGAAMS